MKKKILIVLMTCIILLCACGRVKTNNSKTPDTVPETASFYKVIIEELQPYYADKKGIDETIKIISDRCQKVLDER